MTAATERIWRSVEELADRAPGPADLRAHRLELVGAQRLRARGEDLPGELRDAQRLAAMTSLSARTVLRRVREAYDGRLVLMKGPEIAALHPDPALRAFGDLDLLADDAGAAHRSLLAAGFAEVGRWAPEHRLHHLRPLAWPGLPLQVELHTEPHFADGLTPPPLDELLGSAVASRCGVDGVGVLGPAEHTLVVAVHAWAHGPLSCIGRLADVALLAQHAGEAELEALARRWGCLRLWRTTRAATDALFLGERPPAALAIWARHLRHGRERMVVERHVAELLGPLWGMPGARGPAQAARVLARRVRAGDGERPLHMLRRAARSARNARLSHSAHDARLPLEDLAVGAPTGLTYAPLYQERSPG